MSRLYWLGAISLSFALHCGLFAWLLYENKPKVSDIGGMSGELSSEFASVMIIQQVPLGEIKKQTIQSVQSAANKLEKTKKTQALIKESKNKSNLSLKSSQKINIKDEKLDQEKQLASNAAQERDSKSDDSTLSAPKASVQNKVTSPVSGNAQTIIKSYQGLLAAHLNKFKKYPNKSIIANEEGVAFVRISIDESGNLISAHLLKGSGFAALDDEALALFNRATPLPKPPQDLLKGHSSISFTLPLDFNIQQYLARRQH